MVKDLTEKVSVSFIQNLSARERILILVMSGLIMALIIWFAVIMPLSTWQTDTERAYKAAASEAQEIRAAVAAAKDLQASAKAQNRPQNQPVTAAGDIRTIVSQSTQALGLSLSRLQPEDGRGLNIWLDDVDGSTLMGWINKLYEDHGIRVAKASIQRGDENAVRAQFLLVPSEGQ